MRRRRVRSIRREYHSPERTREGAALLDSEALITIFRACELGVISGDGVYIAKGVSSLH